MSMDPINLNDVLKNAQEVTSLASTDRVMVVDSTGAKKRISRGRLVKESQTSEAYSSPQWVRFGYGASAGSAFFEITTQWGHTPGIHLLVDMITHPNSVNYNKPVILSRQEHSTSNIIDKLRVVCKNGSPIYLDFHYNASQGSQTVFIQLISGRNFSLLPALEGNAEIPEGYTAKEFDMSASSPLIVGVGGGGV